MIVAPMSRLTKRAYHRLCPEKQRKKKLVLKGLIIAGAHCWAMVGWDAITTKRI